MICYKHLQTIPPEQLNLDKPETLNPKPLNPKLPKNNLNPPKP